MHRYAKIGFVVVGLVAAKFAIDAYREQQSRAEQRTERDGVQHLVRLEPHWRSFTPSERYAIGCLFTHPEHDRATFFRNAAQWFDWANNDAKSYAYNPLWKIVYNGWLDYRFREIDELKKYIKTTLTNAALSGQIEAAKALGGLLYFGDRSGYTLLRLKVEDQNAGYDLRSNPFPIDESDKLEGLVWLLVWLNYPEHETKPYYKGHDAYWVAKGACRVLNTHEYCDWFRQLEQWGLGTTSAEIEKWRADNPGYLSSRQKKRYAEEKAAVQPFVASRLQNLTASQKDWVIATANSRLSQITTYVKTNAVIADTCVDFIPSALKKGKGIAGK